MSKLTTPIVVGNWKTTPATLKEAVTFIKKLDKNCLSSKVKLPTKPYYLAVPEIFISPLKDLARGHIGSQNISGTTLGQTTGMTSPSQLFSGGASFSIVGHSEVRAQGETVDDRAHKIALSLASKLTTILCVGETFRDKGGEYLGALEEDIRQSLSLVEKGLFGNLIIAYEPIWAVGGDTSATTHECFEVVIAIRRALASIISIDRAKKIPILYGGTVTEETAKSFLEEGGVCGLLIGRASQEVSSFMKIILECHR